MVHIIVFCYIFALVIAVSAVTIQWLAYKGRTGKQCRPMTPLVSMLLILNLYDLFIYYTDNITHNFNNTIFISLGDCLIAVLVLIWFRLVRDKEPKTDKIQEIAKWYVIAYIVIWMGSAIFLRDVQWIRLIIDIPMIGLLITGSAVCIWRGRKNKDSEKTTIYMIIVTIFLTLTYLSYFISETALAPEYDTTIMNLTVIYWLVINICNVCLLRDTYYQKREEEEQQVQIWDLETAMDAVRDEYDLTPREMEILLEIYDGKTNTQIGESLYISESTVKAHIYNVFRKMGVKNRVEVVRIIRDEREKNI